MLENFLTLSHTYKLSKISLTNSKHRHVPLWIMSNILDSFSQLQLPTITKIKWDTKFGFESQRCFYELEPFPNDGDEASFDIYSSVDIIQACSSHHQSIFSIIPR